VTHQQQVAEADHRGQQVVEVVGDAAGELADRLHLLRLGELHLELLALGDVDEVGDPAGALARRLLAPRYIECGAALALLALEPHVERRALLAAGDDGVEPFVDVGAILLGDEFQELVADEAVDLAGDHGAEGGVAFLQAAVVVDEGDADRRLLEEALEALLGGPQRTLEGALAAEIVHDRARADAGAGFARHHLLADIGLHDLAGRPLQRDFTALDVLAEGIVRRRARRHRVASSWLR
jgi:hypothetical protein